MLKLTQPPKHWHLVILNSSTSDEWYINNLWLYPCRQYIPFVAASSTHHPNGHYHAPQALTINTTNLYLAKTDDNWNYSCPLDIDTMICLESEGQYCSISGGLFPIQGHTDCALSLYLNNDSAIKSYCSITVKTININSITQCSPSHYFISIIKPSPIELRCPGFTDRKIINQLLALIIIPEGCSIFTPDFIILTVSSFTSKVPITLGL